MRWRTESMDLAGEEGMLYGELLLPRGEGPFPGAVLCHGMGTDHRAMRPVSQRLVRKGIAALTFDFRGHGKSQGTVDDNIAQDVSAALRFLRSHAKINPKRIALVGHSFGAWVAILAAIQLKDIRALVSISTPREMKDEPGVENDPLYRKLTQAGCTFEYPRCGPLPGSRGLGGVAATLWMVIRGYHARVNWPKTFQIGRMVKAVSLEHMGDFPKLFVHCAGDTLTPYDSAIEIYRRIEPPKEFLLSKGGFHASPLFPGKLRDRWVDWLATNLNHPEEDSEELGTESEA